ncbi:MAG: ABC transporter ATP-binding protein [Syntrophobacteraceae bacterium]
MNDIPAIKASGLSRSFGKVRALDGLNLEIRRGELYGLVGPDGAGKTTAMRLLTAVLSPSAGEAWIAGDSVLTAPESVKEKIGYMSQRFGLYEDLTVIENIDFYADLYEVPRGERPARIERLLGFSNLTPFRKRLAGNLSGGMKQKLGLACALVHTPEVLFLDEPTNGVDPVSRRDFWKILYDMLRAKITVFLSTSYLDEAERCTRIGLINNGRLLAEDSPVNVRRSLGIDMVELWPDDVRRAGEILGAGKDIMILNVYGDRIHLGFGKSAPPGAVAAALGLLESAGVRLKARREILPSLEDVFIAMVGSDA